MSWQWGGLTACWICSREVIMSDCTEFHQTCTGAVCLSALFFLRLSFFSFFFCYCRTRRASASENLDHSPQLRQRGRDGRRGGSRLQGVLWSSLTRLHCVYKSGAGGFLEGFSSGAAWNGREQKCLYQIPRWSLPTYPTSWPLAGDPPSRNAAAGLAHAEEKALCVGLGQICS